MNKKILILIILIFAGLFYWYEWRPSQLKKHCSQWALKEAKTSEERYDPEAYDDYYIVCLRKSGY